MPSSVTRPRVRGEESGQQVQEGGLAGSVGSDDPDQTTGRDLERRARQDLVLVVAERHAFGAQHREASFGVTTRRFCRRASTDR